MNIPIVKHMNGWLVAAWVAWLFSTGAFESRAQAVWNAPGPSLALSDTPSIVIQPSLGRAWGEAREIVYVPGERGGRKGSELIWDITDVMLGGLALSANLSPRWTINAGAWTALNEGRGEMRDYDWFVEGWPWTDRSISEVAVTDATLYDVQVSMRVWQRNRSAIRGQVGFRHDTWRWEDSFQSFVYSIHAFRDVAGTADGINTVNYEQCYRIPYAGLSAETGVGPVTLDAYVRYSPLVEADDRDHHVIRQLHFEETFSNGNYVAAGLRVTAFPSDRFFVSGAVDVQAIPEIIGDMRVRELDLKAADSAGIEFTSTTLSAQAGWRF